MQCGLHFNVDTDSTDTVTANRYENVDSCLVKTSEGFQSQQ
jgi:hypothetical protein